MNTTIGTAGNWHVCVMPPISVSGSSSDIGVVRRTIKIIGMPMAYMLSLNDGVRQLIRNTSDWYVTVYAERGSIAGKMAMVIPPAFELPLIFIGNRWEVRGI